MNALRNAIILSIMYMRRGFYVTIVIVFCGFAALFFSKIFSTF